MICMRASWVLLMQNVSNALGERFLVYEYEMLCFDSCEVSSLVRVGASV